MVVIKKEERPTIVDIVKQLANHNFSLKRNFFMLITGAPGTGKSYTAMLFAEALDEDFFPSKQMIYFPEDFPKVFDYVKNNGKRVIVFDEAHITAPSRKWHSLSNLALNQIMTTFRQIKQVAVFVVAPSHNVIDKQLRELFDYICILNKVMDKKETVLAQLYKIEINRYDLRDQNPYIKKIRFVWNGNQYVLGTMKVPLPSQRVRDEYEKISMPFKEQILASREKLLFGKKEVKDGVEKAD
jgi:ABC-type dipeptide/oligopeptide/nickel transport system ATPase component